MAARTANLPRNNMGAMGEMVFDEIFPDVADEELRLKGGPYACREKFIPIEELPAGIMDMESIIDARRISKTTGEREYFPTAHDLLPFHAIMALLGDEDIHPRFSSLSRRKAYTKTTYHRGGRRVIHLRRGSP
ncbi:MAG: hypothetical protein NUV61_02480 [Candidatus Azambacteria bacterium]|nr:hypothetical protein [Candidatus Azambacteria bacterium]